MRTAMSTKGTGRMIRRPAWGSLWIQRGRCTKGSGSRIFNTALELNPGMMARRDTWDSSSRARKMAKAGSSGMMEVIMREIS